MGSQFNNLAKVDGQIENGAYFYFWRFIISSVYPCPEGYKE